MRTYQNKKRRPTTRRPVSGIRCRYRTIGRSARGTRSVGLIDIKRRNAKLLRCAMHEICMQRFGGKNIGSHRSDVTESIGSHRRFRPPPDVAYVKSAPIIKAGENKYVPEQISCYIVDCCPHCHVICGRKHRPRARRPGSNSCQHTHHACMCNVLFLSPTMHQEQMMVLICRSNCTWHRESVMSQKGTSKCYLGATGNDIGRGTAGRPPTIDCEGKNKEKCNRGSCCTRWPSTPATPRQKISSF